MPAPAERAALPNPRSLDLSRTAMTVKRPTCFSHSHPRREKFPRDRERYVKLQARTPGIPSHNPVGPPKTSLGQVSWLPDFPLVRASYSRRLPTRFLPGSGLLPLSFRLQWRGPRRYSTGLPLHHQRTSSVSHGARDIVKVRLQLPVRRLLRLTSRSRARPRILSTPGSASSAARSSGIAALPAAPSCREEPSSAWTAANPSAPVHYLRPPILAATRRNISSRRSSHREAP
jgi:hypothetical protein